MFIHVPMGKSSIDHEFHLVLSPRLQSPTETPRDDWLRDLRRAVQITAALRFSHRCKAKAEIMKALSQVIGKA